MVNWEPCLAIIETKSCFPVSAPHGYIRICTSLSEEKLSNPTCLFLWSRCNTSHYWLPQSFTLNGCMSESQRQLDNYWLCHSISWTSKKRFILVCGRDCVWFSYYSHTLTISNVSFSAEGLFHAAIYLILISILIWFSWSQEMKNHSACHVGRGLLYVNMWRMGI